MTRPIRVLALIAASCLYWQLVCQVAEVREPWDAGGYWTIWYPASVIFSAAAGWWLKRREGWAGVWMTFAQFPVLWIHNPAGTLWTAALLFLSALAIPAITASWIAGWLATRPMGQ